MAKKSNFTGLFGYGNSLTNYTKNLIPNNRARYNLTAVDGTDFGTVSYDAMEAVKNNTLDRYKPKSKKEKHTIENFRKYQHISLPGSDYKVSYDAYSAINNGNLDSYKPKTDDEKKAIKAFKNQRIMPLSVDVDGKTKEFGTVSYNAVKAFENGSIDSYVPVDKAEKKAIDSYVAFAEEQAKKERNPKGFWQGLLHSIGYTAEKVGAGLVDGVSDAGSFVLASTADSLRPITWGSWDDALKSYAEYQLEADSLGDMWDKSAESRYRVPDWYREWGGTTAFNFGSLIPAMAAEYFSASAAPTGEAWLAKTALGGTAKTTAKAIAPKLIKPKVSDIAFGLSAAGSAAKAGYAQSGDVEKSLQYGILNGLGEVATEKLFGGIGGVKGVDADDLIDLSKVKGISRIAKNKYGNKALSIGLEGVEEIIMSAADPALQRMTVNPKADWSSFKDTWSESALQGILLSSFSNAATFPIRKYQKTKAIRILNKNAEAINSMMENDSDKFELLKNNATIEEIEERQKQIKVFRDGYAELAVNDVISNNPEIAEMVAKNTTKSAESATALSDHGRYEMDTDVDIVPSNTTTVAENTIDDSVQTDVSAPVEVVQQDADVNPADTATVSETAVAPTNVFTAEADELASTEMPTVSVGDVFTDTKTGNTIRVVSRDAQNTTVEIDTGSKVETRVYTNKQADTLAVNDQYEQVVTEKVPAETAEKRNISLTKVGDFYSAFNDDAVELADKLGLKVVETTRHGESVKLVGFPVRYLDTYASKLGDGYNFTVEEQPSVTSTNPENVHVNTENTPENVPVTNIDVAGEDNLPEAFRRDEDGEIRFNQLEINYDNATMRNGQFKIGKSLNSDATSETVNGMICGKYGIHKTPEGQYNVSLLTSGFALKTFDKLKEAKTATLYLDEHLAFNDVSFKRGISGAFYLKQTDELKKYLSDAKQILDNKKYDTAVPATTDIQNGNVPFSTKSGLVNYVKAHIGDKVQVTFNNGISEIRTLEGISNTNLRTRKPDGSASNAELKGIKYNDTGFSIDYNTGVSVNYDFVNVGEETKTTITENLNKTSNKDLQTSADNDIIEESTSENEVIKDGIIGEHDSVRETQLRENEEARIHGRGNQADTVGDSGNPSRGTRKDISADEKVSGDREGARRVNGVFHGTTYQFSEFLKSYIDLGVHFGSESQARARATDDGYIMKRDLILKNPLKTKDIFGERTPREYVIELIENSELLPNEKESLFKEFNIYCETDISAQAKKSLDEKLASGKYQNKITIRKDGLYVRIVILDNALNINEIPMAELIDKNKLVEILGNDTAERILNTRELPEDIYALLEPHIFEAVIPFEEQYLQLRKIEEILKSFGYDGFVYQNENEGDGMSYAVFDNIQILDGDTPNNNTDGGNEDVRNGVLDTESGRHNERDVSDSASETEKEERASERDGSDSEVSNEGVRENVRTVEDDETAREQRPDRNLDNELREREPGEGDGRGENILSDSGTRVTEKRNTKNYVLGNEIDDVRPNETDNIAAIKLLKELEESGKQPTKAQKDILAKYKGFGGLKHMFLGYQSRTLENLLTEKEYKNAKATINDSFYTPTKVIDSIYKGIRQLGFTGGVVLEPSLGTGNFFGRMPRVLSASSQLHGVEIDSLTGRIASMLYPDADIKIAPFQDTNFKEGSFDLVIGNVPFSEVTYNYKKGKYSLHDYFFLKSLDLTSDGGLCVFLTSTGTLDKLNPKARNEIMKRANVVASFRLPSGTFSKNAATDVTTDLIFLQKRAEGEESTGESIENIGELNGIPINEYYVKNPKNILGKLVYESNQFGGMSSSVKNDGDLYKVLNRAMSKLPKDLLTGKTVLEPLSVEISENDKPHFVEKDGRIGFVDGTSSEVLEFSGKKAERARGYIRIKGLYNDLLNASAENRPTDAIRKKLNSEYDKFVKSFGNLQDNANRFLNDDTDFIRVSGLELYNPKTKGYTKSDIFTKDTVGYKPPKTADNSTDALAISVNETGGINFKRMQQLTGKTKEELAEDLKDKIIMTPDGDYELIDVYLSGNVREKYKAVEGKPYFERNAELLKAVIPADKTASEIKPQLGATWIEPKYISGFIKETFETYHNPEVNYDKTTGTWSMSKNIWGNRQLSNVKYGTSRISAFELTELTLNMKSASIYDRVGDNRVLNKKETQLARQKQQEIKEAFENWIFKDKTRRDELVTTYNELFNSNANMQYGSLAEYLTFPGLSESFKLRDYQKSAVARVVFGGNTLLAHGVGTGKTAEMIASAMELKRMGIVKKNMMIVPKHKVGDFRSDILKMYPEAKVLMATEKDFTKQNRAKLFSKIATNDWDIVVIGHTSFNLIPVKPETQGAFIEEEIADLESVITSAKIENGQNLDKRFLSQLEKTKKAKEEQLKELLATKKDDTLPFEDMGIDSIFVDEAHNFKNLPFYTKLNVPGIRSGTAKRAQDLYMKANYLRNKGGRTTFATATPITNTVSELYNMTRYIRPDLLRDAGIYSFDGWAATFGTVETKVEISPDGRTFRTKERFSKYHNVPEMIGMSRMFMDVLKTADVVKELPKAEYIDVISPATDIHDSYVESITDRMKNVSSRGQNTTDNMLLITNDGRAMATDLRLVASQLEGYDVSELDVPESKINQCVRNIVKEYKDSTGRKGTQFVFLDFGISDNEGARYGYNLYNDLINKLVAAGIPQAEIAKIGDYETTAKKDVLFEKVNEGSVRVLIGSTAKMGEGMNAQNKSVALHHLNAPYRPSDIEQREGRILRFGNENKNVRIYRYIQEKSFDSYMWQMLARKAEFINQAMSDGNVTELEETDEFVLNAKTGMAIATGNPLIMEKVEIDEEVKRLQMLQKSYKSNLFDMEDRLAKLPMQIERAEDVVSKMEADLATVKKNTTEDFSITIGKTKYDKRADAGTALEKVIKNAPKNGTKTAVGSFKGLALSYIGSIETGQKIVIDGEYSYTIDISSSGLGNITRIANEVDKIEQHLTARKMILENLNKELATIKTDIKKEFAYQGQLDEMLRKQADINAQLNMDKVNEDDVSDIIEEMDGEFDDEADDSEVSYSLESEELSSENKDTLHNGSEQRNVGEYSGRSVAGLAKATESGKGSFNQRKAYIEKLTSNQIEDRILTDEQGNRHRFSEIKRTAWNDDMLEIADYYENKGVAIHFTKGNTEFAFAGKAYSARAMRVGNEVYISYDNANYTPQQLAMHEYVHIIYSTEEFVEVKQKVIDNMSETEYNEAIESIKNAYGGISSDSSLFEEELICNILSGTYHSSGVNDETINSFWRSQEADVSSYNAGEYAESIDAGGNEAVVDAVGFGEDYSLDGDVSQKGALTNSEWQEFYNSLGELKRGMWFPQTADGDYIFETRDKLIFTDGKYMNPKINRVIIFEDLDAEEIEYGKETIWSYAKDGNSCEECCEIARAMLGKGLITQTNPYSGRTNRKSKNNQGKGKYSLETDRGNESKINYSLDVLETVDNEISELTPERKKQIHEQFERDRAGVPKVSAKQAWGERASWVAHNMTRVFPDIPERGERGTFFAEFRKMMIQWKSLPNTASFMAQDKLNQMTDGLTPDEFKTFSELVYFLDLQEEAQIQKERGYDEILLPNEITAHEVDEIVAELNEEASDKVKEALKIRQSIWNELKDQYIALNQYIGFDTDGRFKRKNYYHHQVIEYMSSDVKGTGKRNMGIKAGRGWLKERHGSTMAINTDFLAVEYKAILQMQYDVYVANMLGKIKNQYDIKPKLEQEAFDNNKKLLNDLIAEEATDEDGNVRLDSKGNPDSDTYRQQKWYNQRIMFGFSGLFDLAETNSLPEFDGQYGNVIRALKKHSLNVPGLYKYVGDLASMELAEENDAYEQAQISARTVMKYTSQKKAWIRETLGDGYQTWETIAEGMSDTHSIHQPRRGNYFYTKTTIDEDAFNTAFSEMVISLAAGDSNLEKSGEIKKLFAQYSDTIRLMGAAFEQWVLPNEIVSTMDTVANPKQTNVGQKLARSIVSAWKGWSTSINPLRTVKFGIRNLFGDLDAVIAGNPKIVTHSKQAVQEIYQAMKHRKYTPEFMEWVERGGYTSMIFANEMNSEMQDKLFSHLKGKDGFNIFKIPAKLFEGYYNGVEVAHNFREAILRYSAYLHFKQEITKNGGEVKDNVASNRYIVKGLQSVEDKAYQLSKDLLGAYDEVAMLGQTLRRYFIPFYSFTETNMKRYYRLFENVITADDAIPKKAGKLLVKGLMVNMLGLLLVTWNRLVKREEDDELPPSVRNVPHLTLGKIGDDVYSFRQLGSFSEILEWLGFEDYKWTKEDLVAPVDKAWGMITPFVKLPIELVSGLNFYPSLAQPRAIRDRWEHFFNSFGLDDVYREVVGKPTKGIGDIAKGSTVYTYDYKESAYYEILDLKYNFQGDEGGDIYKPDKKANALYYMKTAIRYKDKEAALKYLDEYFENGGTGKGIAQSISMLNPMYGFTGKETAAKGEAFVASLSEDDKEKLKIAQRYYEDDLMLPEKVATMLRQKGITNEKAKNLLRNYIATKCK